MPKITSLHDVLEPLKQALLASRDVIISSQICVSKLQRVFTSGDGCWLPILPSFSTDLEAILVAISLALRPSLCNFKSQSVSSERFEIAAIPICDWASKS